MFDILERDWKMDQEEVDVAKTPRIILGLGHLQRVFSSVVIIPQLCGHENVFTFYDALPDSSADAFTCFGLVLVVVRSVK